MSTLMFWNKQNNNKNEKENEKSSSNGSTNELKNGKKNWLHAPDALLNGHVVYLVKFFGHLPVDEPKGIEIVKDVIRKLQFSQQMRKAETGSQEKFQKLEITISVDGVAIQEPRTQKILHQFPLHNISYCADEKGVKKFFSFIAKTIKPSSSVNNNDDKSSSDASTNGNGSVDETHECFVFISNKLASDITLTIGQAFELAYSSEKTELVRAQQQIASLERTIDIYKDRLLELATKVAKPDLDTLLLKLGIKDLTDISGQSDSIRNGGNYLTDSCATANKAAKSTVPNSSAFKPTIPLRNNIASPLNHKSSNDKKEELLLNSDSDSDFDPRAEESFDSSGGSSKDKNSSNDLFGFEPSQSFGQQLFFNGSNNAAASQTSSNSFTNEMKITPPLLAPPPKVAATRRNHTTSTSNGSNINSNVPIFDEKSDFFGSDPFEVKGVGLSEWKKSINIDEFSLESLDPLRK